MLRFNHWFLCETEVPFLSLLGCLTVGWDSVETKPPLGGQIDLYSLATSDEPIKASIHTVCVYLYNINCYNIILQISSSIYSARKTLTRNSVHLFQPIYIYTYGCIRVERVLLPGFSQQYGTNKHKYPEY